MNKTQKSNTKSEHVTEQTKPNNIQKLRSKKQNTSRSYVFAHVNQIEN
jgi:hypothetical protein